MMKNIGKLKEQGLHAALKTWYAQPKGQMEVEIDGYIVDIVHMNRLIEIQTGNFNAIRMKIRNLLINYQVKLVYPIAYQKWILKLPKHKEEQQYRRKSPKKGSPLQVFNELVSFPELLLHPNFSLELAMIQEEEVRRYTGEKHWSQNGWVTVERQLIKVVELMCFESAVEIMSLLPSNLCDQFTSADIAGEAEIPLWLAQKMVYCFRKMGTIVEVGNKGRFKMYTTLSS